MKKILSSLAGLLLVLGLSFGTPQAAKAQAYLGAGVTLGDFTALNLRGGYIIDRWVIAPDLNIAFSDGDTGFEINLNGNYRFFEFDNNDIYALGGLSIITDGGGVGLNLGAGADFGLGSVVLFPELRVRVGDGSFFTVTLGAKYVF